MNQPKRKKTVGRWVIEIVTLLSLPVIFVYAFGECLPSDSAGCAAARSLWLPKLIGLIAGTGLLAIGLGRLADYVADRLRTDTIERHDID
ncbi:hypothetical protein KRZ98_20400 [Sphingobium sp. AS12]|uniref:hypothetical protein n=1 Tax=Sphingobium sp. AS12 TaxID=2849495 RepID=UPI001C312324|nr:hypothetical protein [Sphingobium sp. AS12]MBV2150568.1 hypothetical protein [Sphingobium sp. AS12]